MRPTTFRIYAALISLILAGYVIYAEISYRGSSELRPVLIALAVSVVIISGLLIYNPENAITSKDAVDNARQAAAEAGYPPKVARQ